MSAAKKREPFVMVPYWVMDLVTEGEISARAYHLYSVLLRYRNNDSKLAWPSNATLAKRAGIGHRTNVPRYVKQLIKVGAVVRKTRPGTSNFYSFPENPPTVITGGDTPKPQADDLGGQPDITVINIDDTCNQAGLHPVVTHDDGSVITRDDLTRSTEPDRLNKINEHSIDMGGGRAAARNTSIELILRRIADKAGGLSDEEIRFVLYWLKNGDDPPTILKQVLDDRSRPGDLWL